MLAWHEQLPTRYALVERFNHGYIASLGIPQRTRTLEIGAGIGGHLAFEDLAAQEYHALEFRPEFCERLRRLLPDERVHCGDVGDALPFSAQSFDRVIAIHTLEHLRHLPEALREVTRILRPGGIFDVVLPTEGGLAYALARKLSAEPMFRRRFGLDYTPIIRNEHVNTYAEVESLLRRGFRVQTRRFFPLGIEWSEINLVVGLRLRCDG
jgi:SAM-dependent methyltransferase